MNVLYTWVGNSDFRAVDGGERKGPVADTLLHLAPKLTHAVLFIDCAADAPGKMDVRSSNYVRWLENMLKQAAKAVNIIPKPIPKGDPTAFNWVYDAMRISINDFERGKQITNRHYLVGPGTPTMAACTLIISRLHTCAGTLWQVDEKSAQGFRNLELPFDLSFKDAPDPNSLDAERGPGEQSAAQHSQGEPIVRSPSTKRAWQLAERAALSQWSVLILGNTGTGKEELAKHIHNKSKVKGKLVTLNCGAIPKDLIEAELFGYAKGAFTGAEKNQIGKFEAAENGIIFLDEIGELPLQAQTRFLRVLQEKKVTRLGEHTERPVNCRIIAATHRDLWQEVKEGKFRADLYYRLAELIITLDDLKERREDLQAMIDHFWQQTLTANSGFPGRVLTEKARQRLLAHTWPGNVRELKAALIRTAFLAQGPDVTAADVELALAVLRDPTHAATTQNTILAKASFEGELMPIGSDLNFRANTKSYQRHLVHLALEKTGNNKSRAARMLGITPQHLGRLLKD